MCALLAILREVDARPEIARCLVGLARVAISLGEPGVARQHLTESIRLCRRTGNDQGHVYGECRRDDLAHLHHSEIGLPMLRGNRSSRYT